MQLSLLSSIFAALLLSHMVSQQFVVLGKAFTSQGRLLQVEYAKMVSESAAASIGIECSDGVLLAARRFIPRPPIPIPQLELEIDPSSSLPSSSSSSTSTSTSSYRHFMYRLSEENRYIHRLDKEIAVALIGIPADCRHTVSFLQGVCSSYRAQFGEVIPGHALASELGAYLHGRTFGGDARPLAVTALLACSCTTSSSNTPGLYLVECCGAIRSASSSTSGQSARRLGRVILSSHFISTGLTSTPNSDTDTDEKKDKGGAGGGSEVGRAVWSLCLRARAGQVTCRAAAAELLSVMSMSNGYSPGSDSDDGAGDGTDKGSPLEFAALLFDRGFTREL